MTLTFRGGNVAGYVADGTLRIRLLAVVAGMGDLTDTPLGADHRALRHHVPVRLFPEKQYRDCVPHILPFPA